MSPSSSKRQGERVTLPPIRDILGDELAHSSASQNTSQSPALSLRPLHSALDEDRRHNSFRNLSHAPSALRPVHHDSRSDYRAIDTSSTNVAYAHSRSSDPRYSPPYYEGAHTARLHSFERTHDVQRRSASSSALPAPDHSFHYQRLQHRSHSDAFRSGTDGYDRHSPRQSMHSRPLLYPDWGNHRRRDSTDSAWSSQSSSSETSSLSQAYPTSGGLQFQPLPATHLSSQFARLQGGSASQSPPPDQSPFGVLISDVGANGVPPSDPQRLAILRTLRASGSAITLSPAFEDFQNARAGLATARYECPYCRKRFNRPSSLKIHINSHTGEKPFQCPQPGCGRRFSVQSNMRRHMRVHSASGSQILDESSGEEESSQSTATDTPSTSPQIRPTLAPLEMSYPKAPQDPTESTPRPPVPSPRRTRSAHSLSFSVPQSHVRTSGTDQPPEHWQRKPSSR